MKDAVREVRWVVFILRPLWWGIWRKLQLPSGAKRSWRFADTEMVVDGKVMKIVLELEQALP